MKNLLLILSMSTCIIAKGQLSIAERQEKFDIHKFQAALTREMELQFDWMSEDTTLNAAARAKNQREAGSPICYGSKYAGMADTSLDEEDEAKRAVREYRDYLYNNPYFGEIGLKEYYFEFAAQAIPIGGGGALVRYGFIVDANITVGSATSTTQRRGN